MSLSLTHRVEGQIIAFSSRDVLSKRFTEQFCHFFYEGPFRVQYLAQGHFGKQMGKTGIEPPTFWLEDNHSTPSATGVSLLPCSAGSYYS